MVQKLGNLLGNLGVEREDTVMENSEVMGVLEVCIHQARDIRNICIYHKQDVYAKLCLTSDPDKIVTTQIINGGGQNPVFDENLHLDVKTIDSSLKCEVWMLSRVRNYLEDQLLGFALVPLSDVLVANGKLAQEFPLSACDLTQTPSGFVQLSLAYAGSSPEVLDITSSSSLAAKAGEKDPELPNSAPCELDKIEFPDPKIVNENHMMVSEYFGISCTDMDSQSCESLSTAENDDNLNEIGVRFVEGFSKGSSNLKVPAVESPPSSNSTIESPSLSNSATSQSISRTLGDPQSLNQDLVLSEREKIEGVVEVGSASSTLPGNAIAKPVVGADIENDQMVVQQDIVEMYLKSMQQFSVSLANMKLPVDTESGSTNVESASSDEKLQGPKSNSSRLFYGSRAFF